MATHERQERSDANEGDERGCRERPLSRWHRSRSPVREDLYEDNWLDEQSSRGSPSKAFRPRRGRLSAEDSDLVPTAQGYMHPDTISQIALALEPLRVQRFESKLGRILTNQSVNTTT